MKHDFTEFNITNPEENGDEFRSWQIQVNWILLKKVETLVQNQDTVPSVCPFRKVVNWAKLSVAILGPASLLIGGIYTLIRIFGG